MFISGRLVAGALGISALVASLVIAPLAAAAGTVEITSPSNGSSVSGPDVTVVVSTDLTLVPGAQATSPEQPHLHYLLDVDPAPYLDGTTPFPLDDPNIVHSAKTSATFTNVAPGAHTLTVVVGSATHFTLQPAVAPSVSFTVATAPGAQVPAALPNTGSAGGGLPAALGVFMLAATALIGGVALRRRMA